MLEKIHRKLTIPDQYKQMRMDRAITQLLPEYSRNQIQAWIKSGSLRINDQSIKPKNKVKGGEMMVLDIHLTPQTTDLPEDIPLNIVFEDDSLIVINKPVGLVVHPGAGHHEHTLLNALLYHCPQLKNLPRAGILHRLDKNTSGLLIVAKTLQALKNLSHQLKKHHIIREYQAIVQGKLISGGTIDAPIKRHPLKRKIMSINEQGKKAISHFRVLEKFRTHTRLKIRLQTGRTHQIRVHMAHIHHPIVGDFIYGNRNPAKGLSLPLQQFLRHFNHQALHAYALVFSHPTSKESLRLECEIPSDMKQLLTLLRAD